MQKEQSRYTIQNVREADIDAMVKMHAQSWLDTYPNETAGISRQWVQEYVDGWSSPESLERRRLRVKEYANNSDALWQTAKDDENAIIGIISAFRDDQTQKVGAVYVDKSYYGSGLAQQLMDIIIEWADPVRPIELEVASYNERAKAFYRKYQFDEIKGSEHIVREKIPVVTMIRKIKGEKK